MTIPIYGVLHVFDGDICRMCNLEWHIKCRSAVWFGSEATFKDTVTLTALTTTYEDYRNERA